MVNTILIETPTKNEKHDFLYNLVEMSKVDDFSASFFLQTPIEIGVTTDGEKIYLNYLSNDKYANSVSYWFILNEQEDDLNGNKWDFGVIYEEGGNLVQSDRDIKSIILHDDFIERIINEINSYSDLTEWCNEIKNIKSIHNTHRRMNKEDFSWEESLKRCENEIKYDKLLNRHSVPYETKTLSQMMELGKDAYKQKQKRQNDMMKSILDDIFSD